MQYTEIMVRYGELSTKGKNRRNFIDRLGFNVRSAMHDFPELVVKAHRDRMHIYLNGEDSDKVIERFWNSEFFTIGQGRTRCRSSKGKSR